VGERRIACGAPAGLGLGSGAGKRVLVSKHPNITEWLGCVLPPGRWWPRLESGMRGKGEAKIQAGLAIDRRQAELL